MPEPHPATMSRRAALTRLGLIAGGALSAPLVSGVLAGCRATPPDGTFVPQTLNPEAYDLVGTLAELIIPTTDTPGARDAGVPAFIDQMLTTWYPETDRADLLAGLDRLDARARRLHGTPFVEATPEQQTALLEAIARRAYEPPVPPRAGQPEVAQDREENELPNAAGPDPDPMPPELPALFRSLKELTVVGYYTSEVGATEELRVMPMGEYRGDIPYNEVGRAWT